MKGLHERQNKLLRDPAQITGLWSADSLGPKTLMANADRGWKDTLERLGVTLLITREYEHLVLGLSSRGTSWLHLPHPSGLVVDRARGAVHIACTRNPNLLMELRGDRLLPTRVRFLPGALYLHDLALIGGKLYGNSVGQNSIVQLDYDRGADRVWWPKCIERRGKPLFKKNHLQMNSIASARTLRDSFFSASVDRVLDKVPGDLDFPVDRRGVIFSGRTREPVAWGLTRPHSARFYRHELWVDNSGYGEVGPILRGYLEPIAKLDGWTRGLCFIQNVVFVGVSKVLPRFHLYAPGLDPRKSRCGVVALDALSGKLLGRIDFPHGNQIFAIDWIKGSRLPFDGKHDPRKVFYDFNEGWSA